MPYDAEVEYLESTGIQYIDTGIKCAYGVGFEVDGMMTANAAPNEYPVMIGASKLNDSDWMAVYTDSNGQVYAGTITDIRTFYVNDRILAQINVKISYKFR